MELTSKEIFFEDLENICDSDFIEWSDLEGATVFVTGATGLIGYTLVSSLLFASKKRALNLSVVALVRDIERAKERFSYFSDCLGKSLRFIKGTVDSLPKIDEKIDFIVHGASPTASKYFSANPVETLSVSFLGTRNVLELAKEKNVRSFVYLSSMEIYGFPQKGRKVTERDIGTFHPDDARNSYPVGKLASETLCFSYCSEYGVPAKSLRLTQTFGPGASRDDGRIFAYIGRCVAEKTDIVLKTKGETERSYLYTADAASAILCVLLKGKAGESYNAADDTTYCSIADMAKRVAMDAGINVRFEIESAGTNGYPDTLYMDLDTSALRSLGWKAQFPLRLTGGGITKMIWRMILSF